MAQHLEGLMNTSMEKIKDLVDVNTIIGDPVSTPDGTTIIPISRVSFGFVAGGSDIPAKVDKEVFAGGSGAGISIKPQAFIVIPKNGEAKLLEMGAKASAIDGIMEGAPDFLNRIKGVFSKNNDKEDKAEEAADAELEINEEKQDK